MAMSSLPPDNEHAAAPVSISALQHYVYCPRQCALIHLEQEFADNVDTARGKAAHTLVDEPGVQMRADMRVERALPLYSRALGLVGRADLVEFHGETPFPVEYKYGPRAARMADEVQLAAQALCLEEMTGQHVPEGAIYHVRSRCRRRLWMTSELRQTARDTIAAVRALLARAALPPPVHDARCGRCSLREICQPRAVADRDKARLLLEALYVPEEP